MSLRAVPLTLQEYADHRAALGLPCFTPAAVRDAIKSGRIRQDGPAITWRLYGNTGREVARIADPELADAELAASTDYSRSTPDTRVRADNAVRMDAQPHGGALKRTIAPPGDGGSGNGLADASAEEKRWKAKQAELKFRRDAGELVEATAIQAEIAKTFAAVKTRLLGVPSKFKSQHMNTPLEHVRDLDVLIREALSSIANGTLDDADDDEAPPDRPAAVQ